VKIYVLGGSGMLGRAFIQHFGERHDLGLPGVTNPRVDVTNFEEVARDIRRFDPCSIVNFAAICDMEKCEKDPSLALKVHALGSANVALIANRANAEYMYISSACAFDGKKQWYSDTDATSPISVYGKTKMFGEEIARSIPKHYVVRTEWCFGGGPKHDTKFIGKLYRQIASGQSEISAVQDKYGSLSYLPDFCKGVEKLLESRQYGTYHITCEGSASRYEVAKEFVRLLGVGVQVKAVDSSAFAGDYFAPRPVSERLVNSLVPGFSARTWQECLAEYSKEFLHGC
jgi:dTDP-4-dehydrorhamnose reductase